MEPEWPIPMPITRIQGNTDDHEEFKFYFKELLMPTDGSYFVRLITTDDSPSGDGNQRIKFDSGNGTSGRAGGHDGQLKHRIYGEAVQ